MTWRQLAEQIEKNWSAYEIALFIGQGRLDHSPIEVTKNGKRFFRSMARKT